jgi:hypothetical protein
MMTMIGMTRKDELLAYFDRLIAADKNGYICNREIAEVIGEIRRELGIVNNRGITITADVGRSFVMNSEGIKVR